MVQMLIGTGISPNCCLSAHRTPLHMAVAGNATDVVTYLLGHPSIELGPVDCRGNTPLWDAVVAGRLELCHQLRAARAPLQDGVASHVCRAAADNNSEFIELLLKVGIALDMKVRTDVILLAHCLRATRLP